VRPSIRRHGALVLVLKQARDKFQIPVEGLDLHDVTISKVEVITEFHVGCMQSVVREVCFDPVVMRNGSVSKAEIYDPVARGSDCCILSPFWPDVCFGGWREPPTPTAVALVARSS
jgi:hypothetical protein